MWLIAGMLGLSTSSVYSAVIQNDDLLSNRLAVGLKDERALTRYHAHKAQMWLSYAKNERSEGSLTVAGQEAWAQSERLVEGLTQPEALSLTTPVLSVAQAMRRDLWWQIEYLKKQGAIEHAPQALAEAEVMLVWAAGEFCELGWRHAKEHFFAVEQRLYQVKQSLPTLKEMTVPWENLPSLAQLNQQGCQGVNPQYWPITADVAEKETLQAQELNIENVVHFALDRSDLNAEAKNVLNTIAGLLIKNPEINITLMGYTDARASVTYNLKLSQRRIHSVRQYFVNQGILDHRIAEHAKGKQDLMNDVEARIGHAKSRRVVIEFHDVEGKNLTVQPQWRDLQLEP